MENKTVTIVNRYGDNIILEPKSKGVYKLIIPHEWYRIGYKEEIDDILFIDPSGGPMISVGKNIPELGEDKVTKIEIGEEILIYF